MPWGSQPYTPPVRHVLLGDRPHPRIRALLEGTGWPLLVRALSAADGVTVGRAYVDDADTPSWVLLWEGGGQLVVGGRPPAAARIEVFERLRRAGHVGLLAWADEPEVIDAYPGEVEHHDGLIFSGPLASRERLRELAALPPEVSARPADAALIPHLAWRRSVVEGVFGGAQAFLERGRSICLFEGESLVAESYGTARADGVIELGIVAHQPARRRGLGTAASALMALACLGEGLAPTWHCDARNLPSAAIARRLGFAHVRRTTERWWVPSLA
ncbi:MAG: GNAT family N-acetyltransferase [Chloroflexi bacterium]|nr:GNAT family N-acetyltransferase [Chloroflexota bacterium]